MSRTVFCSKLQMEAKGLDTPPYPGELGKRIFENISTTAWNGWLAHQTLLINENRLSLIDPKHRKFLAVEMGNFLFGEGSVQPSGFVAPRDEPENT